MSTLHLKSKLGMAKQFVLQKTGHAQSTHHEDEVFISLLSRYKRECVELTAMCKQIKAIIANEESLLQHYETTATAISLLGNVIPEATPKEHDEWVPRSAFDAINTVAPMMNRMQAERRVFIMSLYEATKPIDELMATSVKESNKRIKQLDTDRLDADARTAALKALEDDPKSKETDVTAARVKAEKAESAYNSQISAITQLCHTVDNHVHTLLTVTLQQLLTAQRNFYNATSVLCDKPVS